MSGATMTHARVRSSRPAEAGITLVELMVAVTLSSLAVAMIFAVYSRSSSAYHTQSGIAELQQTLRAASSQLVKDVRNSGYLAQEVATSLGELKAVTVHNNDGSEGADWFVLTWADTGTSAQVKPVNPPFNAAVSTIVACNPDPFCGFADGDVVMAIRTNPAAADFGEACVLAITALVPGGPKLQHNPGQGAPWNQPGNTQCDDLQAGWADGFTLFVSYSAVAYRIHPTDPRGMLEMSPSGGLIANDWRPLALGIVDLQLALRVWNGAGTNLDGDGDVNRDWLSGENMEAVDPGDVLQVRLSLVARNHGDVDWITTVATPELCDPARVANNDLGDHCSFDPTAVAATSRYYGNHIYRHTTETIDVRNLRIGTGTTP